MAILVGVFPRDLWWPLSGPSNIAEVDFDVPAKTVASPYIRLQVVHALRDVLDGNIESVAVVDAIDFNLIYESVIRAASMSAGATTQEQVPMDHRAEAETASFRPGRRAVTDWVVASTWCACSLRCVPFALAGIGVHCRRP